MVKNKVFDSFDEAVADIHDGAAVMIGGWTGPTDVPNYLIMALNRQGAKNPSRL